MSYQNMKNRSVNKHILWTERHQSKKATHYIVTTLWYSKRLGVVKLEVQEWWLCNIGQKKFFWRFLSFIRKSHLQREGETERKSRPLIHFPSGLNNQS